MLNCHLLYYALLVQVSCNDSLKFYKKFNAQGNFFLHYPLHVQVYLAVACGEDGSEDLSILTQLLPFCLQLFLGCSGGQEVTDNVLLEIFTEVPERVMNNT